MVLFSGHFRLIVVILVLQPENCTEQKNNCMYILNGYIEPDWKIHMCDVRRSEIAILTKSEEASSFHGEISLTKLISGLDGLGR
jgi:hypothetical protein